MLRNTPGKTVARRVTITAIALMIPLLAGCEAGADAPTLTFHQASNGAHAVVNGISINNAFVLGPTNGSTLPVGGSASMFLALFNGSSQSDQLVSASAPGTASSVTIQNAPVSVAPGSSALLTGPEPEVVLTGLTKSLTGGQTIPVTLDFSRSGTVTLQVPVEPYEFYYTMYSTAPTPTPSASVTASPGASASPSTSSSRGTISPPSATSTPKH